MATELVAKIGGNGCTITPKIHFIIAWKKIDRPIVTMMTEMIGSPIIGRSATTCRMMPNAIMKAKVIGKPSQNGSLRSASSHQHTQAPISRNSPCAKFTTREAL